MKKKKKKKKWYHQKLKKVNHIISGKFDIYAKKNLKNITKSKIIVIMLKNIEELLIIFVIIVFVR